MIKYIFIENIIGKYINDTEVLNMFSILGNKPIIDNFDDSDHYSWDSLGINFVFEKPDGYLRTIFLYSSNMYTDINSYPGEFPFDLDFQCTRTVVRTKLGTPSYTGSIKYNKELDGVILSWDRYDWENIIIHYSYGGPYDKIYMITLMTPDTAPEM